MGSSETSPYEVFAYTLKTKCRSSTVASIQTGTKTSSGSRGSHLHRSFLKGSSLLPYCSDSGFSKFIPVAALCNFGWTFYVSCHFQPSVLHLLLQRLSWNSARPAAISWSSARPAAISWQNAQLYLKQKALQKLSLFCWKF